MCERCGSDIEAHLGKWSGGDGGLACGGQMHGHRPLPDLRDQEALEAWLAKP